MHLGLQGWVISSILVGCMWFRLPLKESTESDAATVWRMGYIYMQDGGLVTLPSGNGVRTYVVSCRLWEDMLVAPSRWTQTTSELLDYISRVPMQHLERFAPRPRVSTDLYLDKR